MSRFRWDGKPRGPLLWVLGAAGVGLVLVTRGTPLWWFGGALLLSAWAVLRSAVPGLFEAASARLGRPVRVLGRTTTLRGVLLETTYLSLLVYVAGVMLADIWHGERPVSHDHTVHYFKAWQLHEYFLREGRLFGWSHRWFAGYPVNYLYPVGADLWVNLVHAAGLGLLSFSRAYGVAFWLFHVLTGVSAYRFGRMLGGPHVGFLTGLLLLTDMSEFRLGGWAYTIEYGVWPQALSLAFGMLALCHLPGIFQTRRLAPLGAFALFMGPAIVTHPMQLIFLAVLLIVSAIAAGLADDVRAPMAIVRLCVALGLSLWVACLWLIPFMNTRGMTSAMGVWWDSTYEMAYGLLNLSTLEGTLGYVLAFGMLAVTVTLRSRRMLPLLYALMALFIPVVSSSTFVDELQLPMLSGAFAKVQYLRMATMVKPFWFALAGYFLVSVLRHARPLARSSRAPGPGGEERAADPRGEVLAAASDRVLDSPPRAGALAFVVGALVLPIAVPTLTSFWVANVAKSLATVDDRQYLEDRTALRAWLLANLPDDGFYRVGIFMGHNHDLFDLATELDRPIYKRGFTPASNFIYKMQTDETAVFDAVNLRYAISKKYLPREDFEKVAAFGIYGVYRYRHYRPDPFEVLTGEGDVELLSMSDERIELQVGEGAHGSLRLSVSWFPRWKAYRDGEPVPISLTYLRQEPDKTGFITVPLAKGRYRFVFERTLMDRMAVPIGLLGALVALSLLLLDGRVRVPAWLSRAGSVLDRLSEPGGARLRMRALLGCAVILVGGAVLLAEWRPPIALDPSLHVGEPRRVRYDFLEELADARAQITYGERARRCMRVGDRHICRDAEGNLRGDIYVGSFPTTIEEYRMVRCIRARPEDNGQLTVYYPDVPRGQALVGYYGNDFEGRLLKRTRPVHLQIDVDGRRVYRADTESDNQMHWFHVPLPPGGPRAGVAFHVRATNVYKRWFCFHAQVVDF